MLAGKWYFVGPDNGLFTPVLADAEKNGWLVEIFHLTNTDYWLQNVSYTFHGRDIFAPVAAHLAKAVPLTKLGEAIHDPVRLQMPHPEKTKDGWRAHVTVVDVFGNCATDLPAAAIVSAQGVTFRLHGREIYGLETSYGDRQPGELVALVDSENFVEIAVVNGSAARELGAQVGDVVQVVVE